ncbi:hypothetical protein GUITHDRAFT_156345 [Guillardia theta CCMP2712]|uniref:Uncharacterized protein n=1 Tax=Guillardia theta (strain CCMP2712) TaxID=905079 RepID=L1I911_GUITC|nr:hypothetical protein GUITHDRAFT_156345 [Guillardia theta CCMP2712]EKX32374.1 hypothetical protein GUITHDRAFT_156345 [Guillardia theta CCMP2712]|mmetsp:Transcript_20835/g.69550  ORF Transcript_20835/g.69550 Transcript_20835/m.69550 type:complete len:87 (-) Transcript_20835:3106-3366(-)|eukprot:XP_005819354.1 hypothetical protein GUITHDRAFT_156345 [Guillardia theta CCMP2712]
MTGRACPKPACLVIGFHGAGILCGGSWSSQPRSNNTRTSWLIKQHVEQRSDMALRDRDTGDLCESEIQETMRLGEELQKNYMDEDK